MQITFQDFAAWAGGRAKASKLLQIDKYRAHRLYHGATLTLDEAAAIERISYGVFPASSFASKQEAA